MNKPTRNSAARPGPWDRGHAHRVQGPRASMTPSFAWVEPTFDLPVSVERGSDDYPVVLPLRVRRS